MDGLLVPVDGPLVSMDPYVPFPYDPRQFYTNSTYVQTVNWCEIQYEDAQGIVQTHKYFLVIAHCGGRFDFQFL